MKRKRILVIGLGMLGNSVAKSLHDEGAEVIALDNDPNHVDAIKDHVAVAVHGDSTQKRILEQLGVPADIDAAIVCIGEHFESAVLATANLIDLGVKHVAVRANNEIGFKIMERIGAHDVFTVEASMGKIIAHRLMHPSISQEMEIGDGYRIVQWEVVPSVVGKNLAQLALPTNFRIQVVATKSSADGGRISLPMANSTIDPESILFLMGHEKDLQRFFTDTQ
jgi:trk system potassium uptake protein